MDADRDLAHVSTLYAALSRIHQAMVQATTREQLFDRICEILVQDAGFMERMLRRLLGEDIELAISSGPGVGNVLADPSQVEQIVLNLAVNARDAMPQGGKPTIAITSAALEPAGATAPHVVVAISDTGVGMDAETRDRIFEPFFTTKGTGMGTGLGLATVFGIVMQSGGHLVVESARGKGATFRIYETILLVEDEDQVRTVNRAVLRRSGYNVLDAQCAWYRRLYERLERRPHSGTSRRALRQARLQDLPQARAAAVRAAPAIVTSTP